MARLVLGLDIGITSVGFGVIDIDNNSVVDYGVRLFKEATAQNNVDRRIKRGGRRLKSRKRNRLDDMASLLKVNGLLEDNFTYLDNPYSIRVKGLNNELTKQELCTAILHITKNRGNSLETVEDDEAKQKEAEIASSTLATNDQLIKNGMFVCQIQEQRLNELGKVRGINNNFRTKDYVNELKEILNHQSLNETLKNEIIELVERRRHFSTGPGSEKSPTIYGRYVPLENGEIQYIELIDKMRGKCSLYPNEKRAPKMSFSAELFNLLNDLNNLIIDGEKITQSKKQEVIEVVKQNGSITPIKLSKLLGVPLENISGFRIDKSNKPLLTEFKGYKKLRNIFYETRQEELLEDIDLLDSIVEILTETKAIVERENKIRDLDLGLSNDTVTLLSKLSGITGYHSLSLKAIKEINQEMLVSELNQMQIIQSSNIGKVNQKNYKGKKNIVADDEAILSPVTKRAIRESIKVVNALRKRYGEFDSIVVEMTRDKNDKERKQRISKSQKFFEDRNRKAESIVGSKTILNGKLKEKVLLYEEQGGKCMYTLQPIDLNDLINDPTAYEIDHIIPISISLDDSINNKVLVTHTANQEKGQRTPIDTFSHGLFSKGDIDTYRANVLELYKTNRITRKKRDYLLYDKDITKYSNIKEFINRNLVDTSYANRVVLNTLTQYFKDNDINTKVHTIRGQATHNFRKKIGLIKDRDEDYGHHAIDALIVASIKKMGLLNKILSKYNYSDLVDENTGEVLVVPSEDEYFDTSYISFIAKLKNLQVTKFSHKVDTKPNRQIADETIYSTRMIGNQEKTIKKYKDIYDPKLTKIAEDILNNKYKDKYLMAIHDPETFNKLIRIVKDYKERYEANPKVITYDKKEYKIKGINPFAEYKEQHGYITKFAKKDNGPNIVSMKYIDGNLGNHISITQNYNTEDKKVVLLQISPYRTDFYKSKDGTYKFVTIRYKDVRFSQKINKHYIDKDWYENQKVMKKIDDTFDFQFSLHHDELLGITKKAGEKLEVPNGTLIDGFTNVHNGQLCELVKFTATNNDETNRIEVKPINYYETKRLMPSIGKSIVRLEKYATNVLGDLYKVEKSILKLEF